MLVRSRIHQTEWSAEVGRQWRMVGSAPFQSQRASRRTWHLVHWCTAEPGYHQIYTECSFAALQTGRRSCCWIVQQLFWHGHPSSPSRCLVPRTDMRSLSSRPRASRGVNEAPVWEVHHAIGADNSQLCCGQVSVLNTFLPLCTEFFYHQMGESHRYYVHHGYQSNYRVPWGMRVRSWARPEGGCRQTRMHKWICFWMNRCNQSMTPSWLRRDSSVTLFTNSLTYSPKILQDALLRRGHGDDTECA